VGAGAERGRGRSGKGKREEQQGEGEEQQGEGGGAAEGKGEEQRGEGGGAARGRGRRQVSVQLMLAGAKRPAYVVVPVTVDKPTSLPCLLTEGAGRKGNRGQWVWGFERVSQSKARGELLPGWQ